MKTIQVDMFAVGLGAAVLIQFAIDHEAKVAILADGGVGTGYRADSVLPKLKTALKSFAPDRPPRVDLIVGTHYDGDHLKGLLPIVKDLGIDVGDVWLPPVNNPPEILGPLEPANFLGQQFSEDEGNAIRNNYLSSKADFVEELQNWENLTFRILQKLSEEQENESWRSLPNYRYLDSRPMNTSQLRARLSEVVDRRHIEDISEDPSLELYRSFFASHEQDAIERTGIGSIHDTGTYDSRYRDVFDLAADFDNRWIYRWPSIRDEAEFSWLFERSPRQARVIPAALATIRKSEASGAITATHLAEVVEALRDRRPPVRPHSNVVEFNRPRRFVWSRSKRKFDARGRGSESDLVLNLLGPSEQLVQKHCQKLPIGMYLTSLLSHDVIRRESITPSNQLSYIFTLEMKGQRILISGDAGCYGFRNGRQAYHEDLLRPLAPLHVIQIAHHGGHNYDFYNALLAAGFAEQEERAFLLLSHAKQDPHRPSASFEEFVDQIRRPDNEVALLFTSEPQLSKVKNYRDLIHPVVPSGRGTKQGDIQLSYQVGDKPGWTVDRHSIEA